MLKRSLLALALAAAPLQAAHADWDRGHERHGGRHGDYRRDYHRDYHRHGGWHREYYRPRHVVSFNFGTAPYYPPYYAQPRVVYAVPPAAPAPQVVYINNDNSRRVASDDGRYCREYQSHVRVGGTLRQTYGTACLEPDGSWQIVN